jgi:hypothetical protein
MNQENKASPAPQICEYHPGKQCRRGAEAYPSGPSNNEVTNVATTDQANAQRIAAHAKRLRR